MLMLTNFSLNKHITRMPSQKQIETKLPMYLSAGEMSQLLLVGPNICYCAVLNIKNNRAAAELESDKGRTMFVSFSFSYLL